MPYGDVYSQLKLALMNPAEVYGESDGLWLPVDDIVGLASRGAYTAAISSYMNNNTSKNANWFAIPLHYIFPILKSFPDNVLYTGSG